MFRSGALHPEIRDLFGVRSAGGKAYTLCVLSMGFCGSVQVAHPILDAVAVTRVDNVAFLGPDMQAVAAAEASFVARCNLVGAVPNAAD